MVLMLRQNSPRQVELGLVVLQHEDTHLLGLAWVYLEQVPNHLLA